MKICQIQILNKIYQKNNHRNKPKPKPEPSKQKIEPSKLGTANCYDYIMKENMWEPKYKLLITKDNFENLKIYIKFDLIFNDIIHHIKMEHQVKLEVQNIDEKSVYAYLDDNIKFYNPKTYIKGIIRPYINIRSKFNDISSVNTYVNGLQSVCADEYINKYFENLNENIEEIYNKQKKDKCLDNHQWKNFTCMVKSFLKFLIEINNKTSGIEHANTKYDLKFGKCGEFFKNYIEQIKKAYKFVEKQNKTDQ